MADSEVLLRAEVKSLRSEVKLLKSTLARAAPLAYLAVVSAQAPAAVSQVPPTTAEEGKEQEKDDRDKDKVDDVEDGDDDDYEEEEPRRAEVPRRAKETAEAQRRVTTRTKTGRKRARPRTWENEPPYSGDDFTESVKKRIRQDFSKWSNLETSNQGQRDEVIAPGKQLKDQLEYLCKLSLDSVPSPCPSDYAEFVGVIEYTWRLWGCPRFLPRSILLLFFVGMMGDTRKKQRRLENLPEEDDNKAS